MKATAHLMLARIPILPNLMYHPLRLCASVAQIIFLYMDLCNLTGIAFFRILMFSISTTVEKAMAK